MALRETTVLLKLSDEAIHATLRATAKVLIAEGLDARKHMLAQIQEEQRAFWTGAYHAYMKAAASINELAAEYEEKEKTNDAGTAPGRGGTAGDAGHVAPAAA